MGDDEPTMLFYDASGNRVSEDDPAATRQFLSDDPNRPDSKGSPLRGKRLGPDEADAGDEAEETDAKAVKVPTATKAKTSPDDTKGG